MGVLLKIFLILFLFYLIISTVIRLAFRALIGNVQQFVQAGQNPQRHSYQQPQDVYDDAGMRMQENSKHSSKQSYQQFNGGEYIDYEEIKN